MSAMRLGPRRRILPKAGRARVMDRPTAVAVAAYRRSSSERRRDCRVAPAAVRAPGPTTGSHRHRGERATTRTETRYSATTAPPPRSRHDHPHQPSRPHHRPRQGRRGLPRRRSARGSSAGGDGMSEPLLLRRPRDTVARGRSRTSSGTGGRVGRLRHHRPALQRPHSRMTRSNSHGAKRHGKRVCRARSASTASLRTTSARLTECGRVSRGWVVASVDYRHAFAFQDAPPTACGSCGSASGSRPTPTRRSAATAPRRGGRRSPTCTGRTCGLAGMAAGARPTSTYLRPARRAPDREAATTGVVTCPMFTAAGDTILDPWAGSCTTGRPPRTRGGVQS